jgi:predicted nucleic acid-binding protein
MFLLDSNIVIYAAKPEHSFLTAFIAHESPTVSAVTVVEVLGYHKLTPAEKEHFEAFFAAALVLHTTREIVTRAASLRQSRKTSLGDALVAATAFETG